MSKEVSKGKKPKTLKDFNGDAQAYANYLESAEHANDQGYDVIADAKGNIYTSTNNDWTQGHGHKNVFTGYDRPADDKESIGKKWYERWLKYSDKIILTEEEVQLLDNLKQNDGPKLIRK